MELQSEFLRSKVLNNIPSRKRKEILHSVESSSEDIKTKSIKMMAINRYAEANIPILYWDLKMENFVGDKNLLEKYHQYINDLRTSYLNGVSFCLAGSVGLGKTLTMANILKKASQKGYSTLYTTLENVISALTQSSAEEKFLAKRELMLVDFLVLDEVDNRYFSQSESMNDLFAKSLEIIVRTRMQNKLPILMATNSPNIKETFSSFFKESLDSLLSKIEMIYVFGEDQRKKGL